MFCLHLFEIDSPRDSNKKSPVQGNDKHSTLAGICSEENYLDFAQIKKGFWFISSRERESFCYAHLSLLSVSQLFLNFSQAEFFSRKEISKRWW
jgi:hypothetical protein